MRPTASRKKRLAAERRRSPQWWQLSFATETAFLGAAVVWARGIDTAIERCRHLGISPQVAHEVMAWPIRRRDTNRIPKDMRNRIIAQEEFRLRLAGERVEV